MTTEELATELGVPVATLAAWRARGCPSRLERGEARWNVDEVRAWLESQLTTTPTKRDLLAVEVRRKKAAAARLEHQVAADQERYVLRADVESAWAGAVHRVRTRILALAPKLVGRTRREIEDELRDALTSLARGNDGT